METVGENADSAVPAASVQKNNDIKGRQSTSQNCEVIVPVGGALAKRGLFDPGALLMSRVDVHLLPLVF